MRILKNYISLKWLFFIWRFKLNAWLNCFLQYSHKKKFFFSFVCRGSELKYIFISHSNLGKNLKASFWLTIYNKLHISSDNDRQRNLKLVKMAKKWSLHTHFHCYIYMYQNIHSLFFLLLNNLPIFVESGQAHKHIFQIVDFTARIKRVLTNPILEITGFIRMQQTKYCV